MSFAKPYFILFAHNPVVEGKTKAAIYDLKNARVYYIPRILVPILREMRENKVEDIVQKYTPDQPDALLQYVHFFLENDLGFFVRDPNLFPPLPLQYYYPGQIHTAVIETDLEQYELGNVLAQLNGLSCRYIDLYVDWSEEAKLEQLQAILSSTRGQLAVGINLYIKYHATLTTQALEELGTNIKKVKGITIYGAPSTREVLPEFILYTSASSTEIRNQVKEKLFLNIPYFNEANFFNPYYHQKVAIDKKGEIRNSLNHPTSYGRVPACTIQEVVDRQEFRALWFAAADQIPELQGQETRYAQYTGLALNSISEQLFPVSDILVTRESD